MGLVTLRISLKGGEVTRTTAQWGWEAELSGKQTPAPFLTPPLTPSEGVTHILWFEGCWALTIERQELRHFFPEARRTNKMRHLSEHPQPRLLRSPSGNLRVAGGQCPTLPSPGTGHLSPVQHTLPHPATKHSGSI